MSNVVCFGEILWDILPGSEKAGGAPMNVAYHLHRMGVSSQIISRVGNDKRGAELISILNNWGISSKLCQTDFNFPTSEVLTKMDANYEMTYDILSPVAWDFIEWRDEFEPVLSSADAFVFGSLITRNSVSFGTLLKMLEIPGYHVFDVNLRAPHYSFSIVEKLLLKTDLLKLNHFELNTICQWIQPNCTSKADQISLLQTNFNIKEIIVTQGSKGASFHTPEGNFECTTFKIDVADTVGSGDAFLAAYLATRFAGKYDTKNQLDYAAALGAFVATKEGACPDYTLQELNQFIINQNNNEVEKF